MSASATQTGYRWYVLAILTIAQTCHGIDRAIIGLVLKPLGQEFELSGAQLGLLAGVAYGIPFALAALFFGYAVDRFNPKALMSLGKVEEPPSEPMFCDDAPLKKKVR